ncbi:hypothetical protein LXL04_010472 [Taraxacum kok-saghyz]
MYGQAWPRSGQLRPNVAWDFFARFNLSQDNIILHFANKVGYTVHGAGEAINIANGRNGTFNLMAKLFGAYQLVIKSQLTTRMDKKRTHVSKIHNRGGGPPWSDLNHDVLFLVMMELGVFDFLSFSGVCKSWRSLALPNKIRFMASKPPMELRISEGPRRTYEYSLLDFGGRSFNGKIYAIDTESRLYEVGIDFEPKLTLLKTKNTLGRKLMYGEFVSSVENLYAMEGFSWYDRDYKIHKLDFGEMKWVSQEENPTEDLVIFVSDWNDSAAIKPGLWSESDSWLCYKYGRLSGNIMFLMTGRWYFPHDCFKVNLKHE